MLKSTKELVDYIIYKTDIRKEMKLSHLVILSILGGMFIALGSVGNLITSSDMIKTNAGLAKFFGASVFPVGLILIILLGAELYTSNCMMTMALVDKKIRLLTMLKILILVWFFNLVGSIFIAYITYETHTLSDNALELLSNMANHKVNTNIYHLILKGILCNVLVCGASLLGYISNDGISKLFGIWFPIMLFIILGYDHVVANMLYLPLALLHNVHGVNILNIMYNFMFVTIGNFIGGGIIIAIPLYCVNKK